ncbi:MAG: Rpn family recombination-promoting nuclease/putative transposase, partial [Eubacteriales bacterium]
MGKEDNTTGEYMRNHEIAADLLNYKIYGGELKIIPEKLRELDTTSIVNLSNTTPDGKEDIESVKRDRDVLKKVTALQDGRNTYLIIGIENQTLIHYAMPTRTMLYDALQYDDQVKVIHKAHKAKETKDNCKEKTGENSKRRTGDEYISRFYKEDKIMPVVTFVVYWGNKRWDGPTSMKEMMYEIDEEIEPYVQDYKLFLIAPNEMEDHEFRKMKTSLGEVFQYIKYSKDKKRLAEIVAGNERYKHLEREAVMVINSVTKSNIPLKEEEEEINMCQALEEMKEDAREEGR